MAENERDAELVEVAAKVRLSQVEEAARGIVPGEFILTWETANETVRQAYRDDVAPMLAAVAPLIRKQEREACARIAVGVNRSMGHGKRNDDIAAAIRQRNPAEG